MEDCKAGIGVDSIGREDDVMKCQVISKNKKRSDSYVDCYFSPFIFVSIRISLWDRGHGSVYRIRHTYRNSTQTTSFSSAFCITIFTRDKIRAFVRGTGGTHYHIIPTSDYCLNIQA